MPSLARAAAAPPEVDALSRDVADLKQTRTTRQVRSRWSHGTLGHVVERPAMIETDMRARAVRRRCRAKPPSPRRPTPAFDRGRGSPCRAGRGPAAAQVHGARAPPDRSEPAAGSSAGTRLQRSRAAAIPARRPTASPPPRRRSVAPSRRSFRIRAASRTSSLRRGAPRRRQAGTHRRKTIPPPRATAPRPAGKLTSRVGMLRGLIGAATALVLVLGSLQIARNLPRLVQ